MQSHYEELAVYKKSLELTIYFEKLVRNFDRYHKYAIGLELRKSCQRVLMLTAKANIKRVRIACLEEAIDILEELRILVRICTEIQCFKSYNQSKFPTECIVNIIKQCEGWKNFQNSSS